MSALTRGPLPARVYWTRRLLVLGTVLLLVLGLARILTGSSDASSTEEPQATRVAATSPATATDDASPSSAAAVEDEKPRKAKRKKKKTRQPPMLAQPEGTCTDSDVAVTPTVADPVAGRTLLLVLELRTVTSPACTWQVSPESLSLKITSGRDDIWSSRQCPSAIPTQSVVIRSAVTTKVGVRWSGRRSDDDCSRLTEWALPGWYHVAAAALAGEPSVLQFQLERPTREVITRTPEPPPKGKGDKNGDQNQNADRNKSRNKNEGNDLEHR